MTYSEFSIGIKVTISILVIFVGLRLMNKKYNWFRGSWELLPLTLLVTTAIQTLLYNFFGRNDFLSSFWFISVELLSVYFLCVTLFLPEEEEKFPSKKIQQNNNDSKVVDLNQYRKDKGRKNALKEKNFSPEKEEDDYLSWETVYSGTDQTKIDLMHSLLKRHNITCHIANRHAASIFPSVEGISLKLMVKKEEVALANQILKKNSIS